MTVQWCSGYHARFTRERPPVRARYELQFFLPQFNKKCSLYERVEGLGGFAWFSKSPLLSDQFARKFFVYKSISFLIPKCIDTVS